MPQGRPKLCDSCRNTFGRLLDDNSFIKINDITHNSLDLHMPREKLVLHENLAQLDASAASGCVTCRLLRQKIMVSMDPEVYHQLRDSSSTAVLISRQDWSSSMLHVHYDDPVAFRAGFPAQKPLTTFAPSCYNDDTPDAGGAQCPVTQRDEWKQSKDYMNAKSAFKISQAAKSIEPYPREHMSNIVRQIERWLSTCHDKHTTCHELATSSLYDSSGVTSEPPVLSSLSFLPTRLISIDKVQDRIWLRLILTSELAIASTPRQHYTTLSYSWGAGVEHFITTWQNYNRHLESIDYQNMPDTFKDACTVTQALGIKFIWIDALCIIKPDEHDSTDWDKESVTMQDIYQKSYLTLSAACGDNVWDGLFRPRPASFYPTPAYRIEDISEQPFVCRQHNSQLFSICPDAPLWGNHVVLSAISTRGWVYQERFLSCHIVHFTRHAVFWECAMLRASEYEPDGCVSGKQSAAKRFVDLHTTKLHVGEWMKVVEQYSNCKLTVSSDRLLAISGIARAFSQRNTGTYLAGLWRSDLMTGLTWFTEIFPTQWTSGIVPRARRTTCPTWSWASLETPVFYSAVRRLTGLDLNENFEWLAEVLSVDVQPMFDPFGTIMQGRITMQGKLTELIIHNNDIEMLRAPGLHVLNTLQPTAGTTLYLDELVDVELLVSNPQTPVCCLRLCRTTSLDETYNDVSQVYLVLQRQIDGNPDINCHQYRRIGLMLEFTRDDVMPNYDHGELVQVDIF